MRRPGLSVQDPLRHVAQLVGQRPSEPFVRVYHLHATEVYAAVSKRLLRRDCPQGPAVPTTLKLSFRNRWGRRNQQPKVHSLTVR